ncbi:MAG: hypothetical protein Hyperionvirus48_1, partial [Hyperionvirus sp.]
TPSLRGVASLPSDDLHMETLTYEGALSLFMMHLVLCIA